MPQEWLNRRPVDGRSLRECFMPRSVWPKDSCWAAEQALLAVYSTIRAMLASSWPTAAAAPRVGGSRTTETVNVLPLAEILP